MPIWFHPGLTLEALRARMPLNSMARHLGMALVAIDDDSLCMSMPVNEGTQQPYGVLHGGASAALAETVGSIASTLCIDTGTHMAVGIEINANHLRPVAGPATVTATARPLHLGKTTHVWDIRIENEAGKLVCISRLTVAVVAKRGS